MKRARGKKLLIANRMKIFSFGLRWNNEREIVDELKNLFSRQEWVMSDDLCVRCLRIVSLTLLSGRGSSNEPRRKVLVGLRANYCFAQITEILIEWLRRAEEAWFMEQRNAREWHSKRSGRGKHKQTWRESRFRETFTIEFPPPQSINKHKRHRVQWNDCSRQKSLSVSPGGCLELMSPVIDVSQAAQSKHFNNDFLRMLSGIF